MWSKLYALRFLVALFFWSICFMEAVNGKVPFCYSWCCLGEKTWHVIDIGTLFFQENKCFGIEHGCTNCSRKWRGNGEERERDSLSTFPHFLYISSLSIHFFQHVIRAGWPKHVMQKIKLEIWGFVLPKRSEKINEASWLSIPLPISKIISFHTRYEKIILGRICCDKVPQVEPAWHWEE